MYTAAVPSRTRPKSEIVFLILQHERIPQPPVIVKILALPEVRIGRVNHDVPLCVPLAEVVLGGHTVGRTGGYF